MTIPEATYPFPLGGNPNGRYRQALTTASSGAVNTAYSTNVGTSSCALEDARKDPVENAGVRAGEIIGYRAWKLDGGFLKSMYVAYKWSPGIVERASTPLHPTWGDGLHAFKTLKQAKKEYSYADVYGEIALWGEVIEHEGGYRAEYAAIRKIICVCPDLPFLLPRTRILRARYRMPEAVALPQAQRVDVENVDVSQSLQRTDIESKIAK